MEHSSERHISIKSCKHAVRNSALENLVELLTLKTLSWSSRVSVANVKVLHSCSDYTYSANNIIPLSCKWGGYLGLFCRIDKQINSLAESFNCNSQSNEWWRVDLGEEVGIYMKCGSTKLKTSGHEMM